MRKTSAARALRRVTLREYLDEPRSSLAARIDLAKRLLTTFGRIHDRGRVHGRIDPRFIMLEGARSFRIEVVDDDPPMSGTREVRAKTPEIEPTARDDVYALGLLLAELFAGDDDLPDGVARVVSLMADPDPMERYANAHVAMCALVRVTMERP